jgi:hypothetical protein
MTLRVEQGKGQRDRYVPRPAPVDELKRQA